MIQKRVLLNNCKRTRVIISAVNAITVHSEITHSRQLTGLVTKITERQDKIKK